MNATNQLTKWTDRLIKQLASLKLAVVVILMIATITAIGTFVEARYDASIAKKLVYDTPWMYGIMGLLCINLIAVMVDRWPWKRRHTSFVLAHVGILILLLGSVITAKLGLDGNITVGIGQKNRWVTQPETDISVWSSFDGDRFAKLTETEVDFFLNPPEKKEFKIPTDAGELKVLRYHPFVIPSKKVIIGEDAKMGAGLRFQVQNANVNVIEWMVQKKPSDVVTQNFGPAQVHWGAIPDGERHGQNEVFFRLDPKNASRLEYKVFYKDPARKPATGFVKEGESFASGWMDLQVHILRVLPKAQEIWEFKELETPTSLSTSAIEIEFQGKQHWLQLNDTLKLFSEKAVYIVAYANRRIDLGFDLFLEKFDIGRYQGTMRAATYSSNVAVEGIGTHTISMNEPLKHGGKTIYQASFQDGPDGQPIASIFSVNDDPGRWIKYLGSLIITLGVIYLFYDKRKSARAMAPKVLKELE